MSFHRGPKIVTDGLILALDAANGKSYPGSGTTWVDLSGNGNNGTLINGPTFDSGNAGSIEFDGIDDHILVTDSTNINPTAEITLESGFMLTDLTQTYPCLIVKDNLGSFFGSSQYGLWIWRGGFANRGIAFRLNNGTTQTISSWSIQNGIISINANDLIGEYSHMVGTYDGTKMRLYLNSVLVSERITSGNIGNISQPLAIGRNGINNNHYFTGNIYFSKIYNRALTPEEIQQNYKATKGRYGL